MTNAQMRHSLVYLAAAGVVLLQSILTPWIQIRGIAPDLLVIFLVYQVSRRGRFSGVLLGFLLGLCSDLLTVSTLGVSSFAFSLSAYLVGLFPFSRYAVNLRLITAGIFLMMPIVAISRFVFTAADQSAGLGMWVLRYLLPGMVYTWLAGLLIFGLAPLMMRRRT